jgi:hypothetical protein
MVMPMVEQRSIKITGRSVFFLVFCLTSVARVLRFNRTNPFGALSFSYQSIDAFTFLKYISNPSYVSR